MTPAGGPLGFGVFPVRVGAQLAYEKFFHNISSGGCADSDCRIFEGQCGSIAILRRVVEVRERASSKAPEDIRVIYLPVSVVALANYRKGDSVKTSIPHTAGAFVEIARILFQE